MEHAKILIVDDDPDFTNVLKTILENEQYTVVTAADRKEGMEEIKAEKPDLAILDIAMHSMVYAITTTKGHLEKVKHRRPVTEDRPEEPLDDQGDITQHGGTLGLNCRKNNPWGTLFSTYTASLTESKQSGGSGTGVVIDESHIATVLIPVELDSIGICNNSENR